ncbi:MAG: twin-arginine translocase TatA/TatE family subunit [Chloroflexi bacterium]|nr:twin-arginine translocase TatA/TatE family subunit [Chloroflexota bacterium]
MFKSVGLPELVIILVIVLLIFGASRLPQIASSMGKAIKEFRKSSSTETPQKAARPRRKARAPRESAQQEPPQVTKA